MDYEPTPDDWAALQDLAAELVPDDLAEARGNVQTLIKTFGSKWATGPHPHAACVAALKGKVRDPDRLCAWLKDRHLGTTKWRGKEGTEGTPMAALQEKEFSAERRRELAKSGAAMSDGSFPVESAQDLMNAIHAIGRASNPAAAKAHIKKRAKALGMMDKLPDDWQDMHESRLTETLNATIIGIVEGTQGSEIDVLIIQPGKSLNGNDYPARVLEAAAPRYAGTWCYVDHSQATQRSAGDKIGRFRDTSYTTRTVGGVQREGVYGRLKVLDPVWRDRLREAVEAGEPDAYGFSHNVSADWEWRGTGSARQRHVKAITKVHSVDLVDQPAAGGRLVAGMDGTEEMDMDREELQATIAESVAAAMKEASVALAQTFGSAMKEALVPPPQGTSSTAGGANTDGTGGTTNVQGDLNAELSRQATEAASMARIALKEATKERQRGDLQRQLNETKLSTPGKTQVVQKFEEAVTRREVTDEEMRALVQTQIEYEAILRGPQMSPQGLTAVRFTEGRSGRDDFIRDLLATFAGPQEQLAEGAKPFRSLKHAYVTYTGNYDLDLDSMMEDWVPRGGYISSRDHKRIQESITTASWAEIMADVMYQRLVRAYRSAPWYDQWRLIVSDIETVEDFRTRHWMAFGGYGDLSAVSEGATYQLTTSPTDQEVTYAISKRGYLDDITMEAIANDQVGVVRRIPDEMGRAAARTLYKFVMNMVTTDNANTDYDAAALYVAGHSNTGTTALSVVGLDTTRQAMEAQTGYGQASEILGARNTPKFIIVPPELTSRAERIVNPSDTYTFAISSNPDTDTSVDPQRFKGSGIQVLTYHELTDATDWFAVANPAEVPTVVMGFFNGRQEPELVVQDAPQTGSVFSADKTTFKIRHIYGGDVIDHRSFYRQVVGG